jgi:hypothetical protein
MTSEASKTDKAHCNVYGHETNHTFVASRKKRLGELIDK